ncbi:MAG: hypothetical protein ACPGQS_01475 [Bradymonadia bacterium]
MNRIFIAIASIFFVGLLSTNASAQKFDQAKDLIDQAEGFYKGSCGKALSGEIKAGIKNAKAARGACAAFRNCKKTCRASKKSAKKSCGNCKGKKGKAKRACKKAQRQCKKSARKGKRNCVKDCRATAKTPECKKARGALVKGFIKAAKALAKNPQCKEMAQKVGAAIKAAGQ